MILNNKNTYSQNSNFVNYWSTIDSNYIFKEIDTFNLIIGDSKINNEIRSKLWNSKIIYHCTINDSICIGYALGFFKKDPSNEDKSNLFLFVFNVKDTSICIFVSPLNYKLFNHNDYSASVTECYYFNSDKLLIKSAVFSNGINELDYLLFYKYDTDATYKSTTRVELTNELSSINKFLLFYEKINKLKLNNMDIIDTELHKVQTTLEKILIGKL